MSFAWRKRWFLLSLPLLLAATAWIIRVDTDLNAFFTATDSEDARLLSDLLQAGELSRRYLLVVEAQPGTKADAVSLGAFSAKLVSRLAELEAWSGCGRPTSRRANG
ncbi:hypothetical protein [Methylogaea oryzae]|uniref:hypothetical protein n=1 Tax=Methylogaea oryzae TaxID=1295382 RepID=UPI0006D15876|nr:hypothetical protein [Methylogaea oryzae]